MTVVTFTGTGLDEIISPNETSPSVTSDGLPTAPTAGADIIYAKGGDDHVQSGDGDDQVFLGSGDDAFDWSPQWQVGGGNDVVDGGKGFDTANFKGFGAEISLVANGGHALFESDTVTVDLDNVERIDIHGTNNSDHVNVRDLSGTDVKEVVIDYADLLDDTKPDGEIDMVNVSGTNGADHIDVVKSGGAIKVEGLSASVTVMHTDKHDTISIEGGAGNDRIDASGVPAHKIDVGLTGDGGRDVIIGSAGNDLIFGGAGKDVIRGGNGNDNLFGGDYSSGSDTAADTLKGGKGADTFWLKLPSDDSKADAILDFAPGIDKIGIAFHELSDALGVNDFGADNFRIGKQAGDADDFIIYNANTGGLFFDADGSGNGKAVEFAILDSHLALSASDFAFDLI